MVGFYGNQPISSERPFIAQTKNLGIPVFDQPLRENKSIFAEAPRDGVPVVLNLYGNKTHDNVVAELEKFVQQFRAKLGI